MTDSLVHQHCFDKNFLAEEMEGIPVILDDGVCRYCGEAGGGLDSFDMLEAGFWKAKAAEHPGRMQTEWWRCPCGKVNTHEVRWDPRDELGLCEPAFGSLECNRCGRFASVRIYTTAPPMSTIAIIPFFVDHIWPHRHLLGLILFGAMMWLLGRLWP